MENGIIMRNGVPAITLEAAKGEKLEITAYVPTGYEFVNWTVGKGTAAIENSSAAQTYLYVGDSDCAVCANLREVKKEDPKQPSTSVVIPPPAQTQPGSVVNGGKNAVKSAAAVKLKKPKKVALKKVKATKRGALKLTWKRNAKATGYQAMVATDKKFRKNKKTATIRKNKTVIKTFTKLKRKKTYYAKVRAYKQMGKTRVYGAYSKVKKAKVK